MRLQYRARALSDIDEIYRYLEKRSPSGAMSVLRALFTGIQDVADHPHAWQTTDDPAIRVKILQQYNYKIFYTVIEHDTVEIIHVRHAARRPWHPQSSG